MATKTFKLGEWAKGGIITVETTAKSITVIGKEWDYSKGSRKSSDQTNAKEFTRKSFDPQADSCRRELEMFLNDLTTSYYSGQIIEWIETKVTITRSLRW